jgi:hypothetical protein
MITLGNVADGVQLLVDDDGLWILRGGMFFDDLVRMSFAEGLKLADAIQHEVKHRCECGYTKTSGRHKDGCPRAKAPVKKLRQRKR